MALTTKQLHTISDTKLLVKAMEEAGEVVQAASKLLLHGAIATTPHAIYDNQTQLLREFEQLHSIMVEYCNRNKISLGMHLDIFARERDRIDH